MQHEELCEGHLEECEGGMLPWGQCGVVPQFVSNPGVVRIHGSAASHQGGDGCVCGQGGQVG